MTKTQITKMFQHTPSRQSGNHLTLTTKAKFEKHSSFQNKLHRNHFLFQCLFCDPDSKSTFPFVFPFSFSPCHHYSPVDPQNLFLCLLCEMKSPCRYFLGTNCVFRVTNQGPGQCHRKVVPPHLRKCMSMFQWLFLNHSYPTLSVAPTLTDSTNCGQKTPGKKLLLYFFSCHHPIINIVEQLFTQSLHCNNQMI